MDPRQNRPVPPSTDQVAIAAETLNFIGLLCRTQGVDVRIEIHDLSREAFEFLDDIEIEPDFRYSMFRDPEAPLWWKRFAEFLVVYTREPPRIDLSHVRYFHSGRHDISESHDEELARGRAERKTGTGPLK